MNIICWNIMYGIDRPLYGGSLEVFVLFSEKKMRKLLCAADQQMNEQDGTVQPLMCRKGEQRSDKSATTVTDVTIKFVFCPIVFFFCGVFSFSLYFFFHSLRFIGPMSIGLIVASKTVPVSFILQRRFVPRTIFSMCICYHHIWCIHLWETKWQSNKNTWLTLI